MTGTGTQTDPYIVNNEADFRTAISQVNKYVKCVPNMVIDLDDRSPYADYFSLGCREIEGNGLIIQNGRFEDYTLYRTNSEQCTVKNINILDCTSTRSSDEASTIHSGMYNNLTFDHCTFRVQQQAGSLCYGRAIFKSCNISIRKARLGYYQAQYVYCYDCNIFMYNSANLCAELDFCYISGNYSGIQYCTLKNCILEPEEELTGKLNNSSTSSSGCVYNKDFIKTWTGSSANFGKGLTTEEIRDRQELYKAGILINPTGV